MHYEKTGPCKKQIFLSDVKIENFQVETILLRIRLGPKQTDIQSRRARSLKFQEEELYNQCTENKGADHVTHSCSVSLFLHWQKSVFLMTCFFYTIVLKKLC